VDLGVVASFGASDVPDEGPREEEGETNGYDELPGLFNLPPREFRQGSVSGELFSYETEEGSDSLHRQPSFIDFGLGIDAKNISVISVDIPIPQISRDPRHRREESGEVGARM
jgi:hypothetical protein